MTQLLFLGESPPPGAAPDFRPFDCPSGDRMARHMLGLRSRVPMLAHMQFANVFDEPGTGIAGKGPAWDVEAARTRAGLVLECAAGGTIVALGEKPRAALGLAELRVGGVVRMDARGLRRLTWVLAMPHPSGRGQTLNTEPQRAAIRAALLPEVVASCPGLAPADFRLDEPAILRDVAVAVSPLRPSLAAAALVFAAERKTSATVLRWLSAACSHVGDTPMDAAHRAGLAIGIGEDDASRHRALRERARFIARTIDFAAVDVHVIRATAQRLSALGVTS